VPTPGVAQGCALCCVGARRRVSEDRQATPMKPTHLASNSMDSGTTRKPSHE